MIKHVGRLRRIAVAGAAAGGVAATLIGAAPAQAAANATTVYVWATDVNMRACASFQCPPYDRVKVSTMNVTAFCQNQGDTVRDGAYVNDWWLLVDAGGPKGWISAVYVRGGSNMSPIPGVSKDFADCR
ncbi:peptidase M23 [Streptomyces sp. TRM49041]|uniref:peptidase M23 n=1 Tax=Streptomyces sp. TRM49041 TaxID=2603216 RepID=UPI0011EBA6DD|nr:peptidase M23 [Streptomyces sp. TRM49041]